MAAVFPPTRIERRTLGEVGERLRSAAGTMGEHVMEAGMQAGERLSEVAEERGLTREGLKEQLARSARLSVQRLPTTKRAGSQTTNKLVNEPDRKLKPDRPSLTLEARRVKAADKLVDPPVGPRLEGAGDRVPPHIKIRS